MSALDNLEGDIRHLSTLIGTTYDVANERPMPIGEAAATMQKVLDLLWIARDMADALAINAAACQKVLAEAKS